MLDISLLGTGGMAPMPKRFLSSMIARLNGRLIIIDCGKGTAGFPQKPWLGISGRRRGIVYTLPCRPYFRASGHAPCHRQFGQD